MNSLSVMIVDDSATTVQKLSSIMETLGHRIAGTCDTGKKAFEEYSRLEPDLVTMDITMPDMDGITATREILSAHPDALIVMVTSHGQRQVVIDAVEAGAKNYILKPFNRTKVEEAIEKVREKYPSL
ncbi:MAG: response regulator [Desulfarculaceae bacterium]|nr:response regulator [Desulfarculaceae bacterium]